jgi:muramoyltetrapeptide carboxypeptidase
VEIYKSPALLRAGSTIGITAPARKVDAGFVDKSAEIVKSWGVNVVLSRNLFAGSHSYLSGSDEQRLNDLQNFCDDPNIDAILCARGGYGTSRIVDRLDLSNFVKKPKWIIGFSDITSLHLRMMKENVLSIHATMPVLFPRTESASAIESVRAILFDGSAKLMATGSEHNRMGDCEGPVVGGNLSLLVDSLGTATEIDTDNKILLIEEIDEYFYKVDRMLTQLKRAGKFSRLKGLVVGYMTDIKNGELTFASSVEEVVLNAVKDYNFPVTFKFPSGHENPNIAWIEGGRARLSVLKGSSSLVFLPLTANS